MAIARVVLGICVLTVAAAAAHQTAVALGVLELGTLPGEGAPGESVVDAVILALPAGALVGGLAQLRARRDRIATALLALLDVSAAAFLLARFLAYDPYYLPTLRRFSEGGYVRGAWVALVVAVDLAAAAATWMRPRAGAALSIPPLIVTMLTAVAVAIGH